MIPEYMIRAWAQIAPWPRHELVEQDLLICRALVQIFSDRFLAENLAFRGGTALHKLYLAPQPRYSEDIDLVQIYPGEIKPIIDHLRDALAFLGEPKTKRAKHNNTLLYRWESEILPVMPMRLKIEINCREHFHHLDWAHVPFRVENGWFSGEALVTTYQLDELLGTKLRALYQRRKGRDLFDLDRALSLAEVDEDNILACYKRYMAFSVENVPSRKEFLLNLGLKLEDTQFLGDTDAILRPGTAYSPRSAFAHIKQRLLERL